MTARIVCLLAFLVTSGIAAAADVTSTKPNEPLFPGSASSLGRTIENADLIVVAVLESSAVSWSGGQGDIHYTAKAGVGKLLKGVDASKELSLWFRVFSKSNETSPAEKGSYIFFLQSLNPPQEGQYGVDKILAATDKNIADIAKMIGKTPGSDVKLEHAVKSADLIGQGLVKSSAIGETRAPGATHYAVRANVFWIWKGPEGATEQLLVVPVRSGVGEVPLLEGSSYIFFLKVAAAGQYSFLKALLPTNKNCTEVQKMLGKLPGSDLGLDEAVENADLIAVTTLKTPVIIAWPGMPRRGYKTIGAVDKVLKGAEERKQLSLWIHVQSSKGELPPETQSGYIIFLKTDPHNEYSPIKMLAATDANIAEVTRKIGNLPGSGVKLEDAVKSADVIAIAVANSVAVGDSDASGAADCRLKVSLSSLLKGSEERKPLSFSTRVVPANGEFAPVEKGAYIFFLKAGPEGRYSFIKMLAANEKRLAEVTKTMGKFPGNAVKLEDAAKTADLVAVLFVKWCRSANRTTLGDGDYRVGVKVTQVLKGSENRNNLVFRVRAEPTKGETGPEPQSSYIFFLKSEPAREYSFTKMLAASDENTAEVTKLIAGN